MLINSARVCAVGSDVLNVPCGSHAFSESCMVPALRGVQIMDYVGEYYQDVQM